MYVATEKSPHEKIELEKIARYIHLAEHYPGLCAIEH